MYGPVGTSTCVHISSAFSQVVSFSDPYELLPYLKSTRKETSVCLNSRTSPTPVEDRLVTD